MPSSSSFRTSASNVALMRGELGLSAAYPSARHKGGGGSPYSDCCQHAQMSICTVKYLLRLARWEAHAPGRLVQLLLGEF